MLYCREDETGCISRFGPFLLFVASPGRFAICLSASAGETMLAMVAFAAGEAVSQEK
jgi:hypothetical protein